MSGGVLPIATGSVVKAVPSPFPSLGVTSNVIRSPFFSPSVLNCGAVAPGAGTLLTSHLYRYVIGSPSMSSPWTSTRSSISIMALDGKIRAERTTGGWLPVDAPLAATDAPPAVETGACGFDSPLQPKRVRTTKKSAARQIGKRSAISDQHSGSPTALAMYCSCHCERSEAISTLGYEIASADFVGLAMTGEGSRSSQ